MRQPANDEALAGGTAQGFRGDTRADAADATRKHEATLSARVALWGGTLTRIEADNGAPQWIVSRWVLTRSFGSLCTLETWIDQVAGVAGRPA